MKENINNNDFEKLEDEIDLKELFNILYDGKWTILSITTLISIIGVIYSLLLPNIYESKALLVPVNSSNSISGALQSYSGLAGLAGISLPSTSDEGNSAKALQKINSLSFFKNNILTNIFLPDLMALKSWNPDTNTLIYDERIYDKSNDTWLGNSFYLNKNIPSAQEAYTTFLNAHLNLIEDSNSGFITLSIKHQSPYVAKKWTELVINEVNTFYRQKDKLESEKAFNYLNKQISTTSLSEIKQAIAKLMQEETKKLTLIEANQYYVFDYIDPPAVMERKSEPKRAVICFISALLGAMLSILLVIIRHYFFTKNAS